MPEISIIVPVYKVEKYLRKCVDSILSQTFTDFELILINDGSPDECWKICEEYAAKDDRIVYLKQENQGLGATRNNGIRIAKGKYIAFVDSDDYIKENAIERLYKGIVKSKADVACGGIYNVYQQKMVPQYDKEEQFVCGATKAFKLLLIGRKITGSSCNKLIKTEILRNVKYPEGVLYEDVIFNAKLMQNVEKVYVDTTPTYYYYHRQDSITTQKFESRAMNFIYAYEENLKVVKDKFPLVEKEAQFKLMWANFEIFDRMLREKQYWKIKEYPIVKKYLKKNAINAIKNPYFLKTRKLGALMLLINVKLYWLLIKVNDYKNKKVFS